MQTIFKYGCVIMVEFNVRESVFPIDSALKWQKFHHFVLIRYDVEILCETSTQETLSIHAMHCVGMPEI